MQQALTLPLPPTFFFWLIVLLLIDLILKGWTLWRSARRGQRWWFIALLIVNSVGILPLIYLLIFDQTEKKKRKK